MSVFKVVGIVDGDTFDVSPNWKWGTSEGNRIRPAGFDAPELRSASGAAAKLRLQRMMLNRRVELRSPHTVDRGRLVCEVFVDGHNLRDLVPKGW